MRGGVATVVPGILTRGHLSPSLPPGVSATPLSLIDGRVLRVVFENQDTKLIRDNVHKHDLTSEQLRDVCSQINRDRTLAESSPESVLVVVHGDFNFAPEEKL
eukprot:7380584-Pyramimonas_sp.AAC.1